MKKIVLQTKKWVDILETKRETFYEFGMPISFP